MYPGALHLNAIEVPRSSLKYAVASAGQNKDLKRSKFEYIPLRTFPRNYLYYALLYNEHVCNVIECTYVYNEYTRMYACVYMYLCVRVHLSSNNESLTTYIPFNRRTLKYMSCTRTFRRLKNKTFYKLNFKRSLVSVKFY